MFSDDGLKIKLYLYSILIFALGTLGFLNPGWEPFGVLMFVLGFVVAGHIAVVSIIREARYHIDAQRHRLEEQKKLYDTVQQMDAEARYYFGLGYAPNAVKVTVDKTKLVGNEFSQVYQKLPVAPYKLKVVAQAALNGEGFTVRKWAGEGKLLSRDEWDAVHAKMVELKMLERVGEDPREGYMWTSLGMDVLAQVLKDTL